MQAILIKKARMKSRLGKIKDSLRIAAALEHQQVLEFDPSVDSLALEEYDYIEPIEKVSQS